MSRALRSAGCRRGHDDRGASAVEFAIIALVLFTLLFGILQYGLYLWAKQAGSAAVRDGARRAAVSASCTDIDSYVRSKVGGAADTWGSAAKSFENAEGNSSAEPEVGDVVVVDVSFNAIDLNLPFIPFIDDGNVTETARSRVEYIPDTAEAC